MADVKTDISTPYFVSADPDGYPSMMLNNTAAANAFNAQQAQKQMDFQVAQNAKAMDFNQRQAELNRNWQKMMSDTAHQREVQDLIAAGLNPVLSALGGNGASVGSGSAASISGLTGSKAEADTSLNAATAGILGAMINGQTQRDVANINAAAAMHNAQLSSDAVKYSANTSYAGLLQQLDFQGNHPNTLFGTIGSILESLGTNYQSLWTDLTDGLKNLKLPEININFPGLTGSGNGSFTSGVFTDVGSEFGSNLRESIINSIKTMFPNMTKENIKKTIINIMNSPDYHIGR